MGKARILIGEDEGIVALDIRGQLISLGYDVPAVVDSGEEAVRKAAEIRPDLILMDIKLKGEMDGVEAVEQILARFDIPVIYLTAFSDWAILQRAKLTEPYAYLLKPIEQDDLRSIVEMALYRRETGESPEETSQGSAT